MSRNQLERLKKDSKELSHFITKLQKQGKEEKVYKLNKKYQYLQDVIQEYTDAA